MFWKQEDNLLNKDTRLKQRISMTIPKDSMAKYFTIVRSRLKIVLRSDLTIANGYQFSINVKDHELKDFMDVLVATLHPYYWLKVQNDYLLQFDDSDTMRRAWLPKNSTERRLFDEMGRLQTSLNALPSNIREKIGTNEGIPVSQLPPKMQQVLQNIIEADTDQRGDLGATLPRNADDFSKMVVSFRKNEAPRDDISIYDLEYRTDNGSYVCSFNDYEQRLAQKGKIQREHPEIKEPTYFPKDFAPKPEELKTFPYLQKKVQFRLKNVNIVDVMQYLGRHFDVEYVCMAITEVYPKRDVTIAEMPLYKCIEILERLYNSTFFCRKTGIIGIKVNINDNDPVVKKKKEEFFEELKKEIEEKKQNEEIIKQIPPLSSRYSP
jgi:hypothetical protein